MALTARAVTTSKDSLVFLRRPPSSARMWRHFTFLMPRSAQAPSMKASFFRMESTRRNCISGRRMARGTPGKPAPVPRSSTLPFSGKYFSSYTVSESYTFLIRLSSTSLMPVRFTLPLMAMTMALYSVSFLAASSLAGRPRASIISQAVIFFFSPSKKKYVMKWSFFPYFPCGKKGWIYKGGAAAPQVV